MAEAIAAQQNVADLTNEREERLAEIARLEEQAAGLGLSEQLADNFARMRLKARYW